MPTPEPDDRAPDDRAPDAAEFDAAELDTAEPGAPGGDTAAPGHPKPAAQEPHPAEPPAAPAPLPRPGWAPFLVPGERVVLRYRIDPDASPHGESVTDALGYIEGIDDATVTVMTKRGASRVVRGLVVAAKQVPPPPVRRRPVPPPE